MTPQESLLAVLLADNAAFHEIADLVCAEDFTPENGRLFAAIKAGLKDGVDIVSLGATHPGPVADLALNVSCSVVAARKNVRLYAELVAREGEKRRIRIAGQRISTCDTFAEAQAALADVRPQQTTRLKTAVDSLHEMLDALQRRCEAKEGVTGVPTGLASLDALTGGWQAGNLVGVGGETSSGKTTFALQAAIAAGRCYYVSLEMTAAELMERVICNIGKIPHRIMRYPDDREVELTRQVYAVIAEAKAQLALVIDDQPGLTPDQICTRARQLHMAEPLKAVVVDHLGLMRRPRKNDVAELGEAAIALKNLAKELGIPVIVLVQLNRAAKQRGDRRPQLEDFRASGEIEEALDVAVMVYRDEYHNPNGPLAGFAEFIVRKQRQGERNVTAWAKSYLSQMRFESCDAPEARKEPEKASGFGGYPQAVNQW